MMDWRMNHDPVLPPIDPAHLFLHEQEQLRLLFSYFNTTAFIMADMCIINPVLQIFRKKLHASITYSAKTAR
jgi:hypothetical protein